jgi:hypothetical protein
MRTNYHAASGMLFRLSTISADNGVCFTALWTGEKSATEKLSQNWCNVCDKSPIRKQTV